MRINIVSDATYYPVKVGQSGKKPENKPAGIAQQAEQVNRFDKLLIDKLSPVEAAAIRKLFGEFKINTDSESNSPMTASEKKGSSLCGKFVDITV